MYSNIQLHLSQLFLGRVGWPSMISCEKHNGQTYASKKQLAKAQLDIALYSFVVLSQRYIVPYYEI